MNLFHRTEYKPHNLNCRKRSVSLSNTITQSYDSGSRVIGFGSQKDSVRTLITVAGSRFSESKRFSLRQTWGPRVLNFTSSVKLVVIAFHEEFPEDCCP